MSSSDGPGAQSPGAAPKRRIDRVLDPAYVDGIGARPVEELRAMSAECGVLETELSYVRRLAQGRIDILAAEAERREAGGSLTGAANDEDLVRALSEILADGPRSDPADSRITANLAPSMAIEWRRGLERLVADSTLVDLANLDDDELAEVRSQLTQLEAEVSGTRRALHQVVDVVERELAQRLAVGQS